MKPETKKCAHCAKEFSITEGDCEFYEKVKVPAPTWCPECRLKRRFAWRNERFLHSRKCSATGKPIITVFPDDAPFPVYSREYWYSDNWDALTYGRAYDQNRKFFEQFADLLHVAPRLQMWLVNSVNSDYSNYTVDSKDCYQCSSALSNNEKCSYCSYLVGSIECVDCTLINRCELCVECVNCDTCFGLKHSVDCKNCRDSWFLLDCANCTDCFGCAGLRNKQYYIWNEGYSKEEYEAKLKEMDIANRANFKSFDQKLAEISASVPRKYMHGIKNQNVTGDYVNDSSNIDHGYMSNGCEDAQNVYYMIKGKDSRDVTVSVVGGELLYECHAIPKNNYNLKFSELCANGCRNLEYCINCDSSSDCFGCVGLRSKQFCIFNTQYAEDEYMALRKEIIDNMMAAGEYGEFFPIELSPFPYHETVAQEYFPEAMPALAKKQYKIGGDVLGCAHEQECAHNCTGAYRVLPQEKEIYARLGYPEPKVCVNCRYAARATKKAPLKLWHRKCMHEGCENEFETSYAPDRSEIVYCESCYQQEVV